MKTFVLALAILAALGSAEACGRGWKYNFPVYGNYLVDKGAMGGFAMRAFLKTSNMLAAEQGCRQVKYRILQGCFNPTLRVDGRNYVGIYQFVYNSAWRCGRRRVYAGIVLAAETLRDKRVVKGEAIVKPIGPW